MISVAGFSVEFALMNPSGFFFYSVYSVAGSVDPYLGTGTVSHYLNKEFWFQGKIQRFAICYTCLCNVFSLTCLDLDVW